MNVVELIAAADDLLADQGVPFAFGGALALGYHAAPRATMDVDVNVFVPVDRSDEVLAAFTTIGMHPERPSDEWMPASGRRLVHTEGGAVIDLFFSLDDTYDAVRRRCVRRPFGDRTIPVLGAEDLVAFKLSFNRPKDWVDVDAIARSTPIDVDVVEATLLALRGHMMYPRLARLRSIVAGAT